MKLRACLPSALAFAMSACLLAGCGGGGAGGMIRAETIPPPPPPPPPPPSPPPQPTDLCPNPITAACVVDVPYAHVAEIWDGRDSDYALRKLGEGDLVLEGEALGASEPLKYRFGEGTTVENGLLKVSSVASLQSDVIVESSGRLELQGAMTGDVSNHGDMLLRNAMAGNLVNDGALTAGASHWAENPMPAVVQGNYTQTSNGTLIALIGAPSGEFLTITGRADIDGTLQLAAYTDDWGPYPLPAAPLSLKVLHADGGVFGQFAQWTSPGLFVTGAVRYLPNDVYFDATSISAVEAMSAAAPVKVDPLTLGSAAHFDAALDSAARWARMPTGRLTPVQRQFLASVGAIQRLQDYDQAVRSLDSLSGSGYAAAADALLQQAAMPSPELLARIDNHQAGSAAGPWASRSAMLASGAGAFSGTRSGFDQWLGDRLLLGSSFAWSDGSLRFDRAGGAARDQSPQWDVYVRRNGNGNTYVFGDLGYSRHQLDLNRQIDLGLARLAAGARNRFDMTQLYVEAGQDFRIGGGRLTPFGAVGYAVLQGSGFVEHGSTGFELIAQPSTYRRLTGAAGIRLGADWRSNGSRWMTWNVTAGYRQLLQARDDARAAFTGTPERMFALTGVPHRRGSAWMHTTLGTGNEHWSWLLSYDRQASDNALSLGATLDF